MTVLLSALVLAVAFACAYLAQATARHGVHGVAYAVSDWFQAIGRGIEHGLAEWRRLKQLNSAPERGAARESVAPIFSEVD